MVKPGVEYRCRHCGYRTVKWAPMVRHVDETHRGGRIEIVKADAP